MEKVDYARKSKIPLYALIIAVVAVAVLAAGIYFLMSKDRKKEPNRGTYVIKQIERSRSFEKTNQ
jgi:flagellar basal body-associated protein FliL